MFYKGDLVLNKRYTSSDYWIIDSNINWIQTTQNNSGIIAYYQIQAVTNPHIYMMSSSAEKDLVLYSRGFRE
jgi:hypothetical protein